MGFLNYKYINNRPYLLWALFFFVLIFEFLFFNLYISRVVTGYYPPNFDQASYLPSVYRLYDNIRSYGFIAGVGKGPLLATGILFPIQAAIFFLILGASRWTVLLINLIFFMLLQLSCMLVMKAVSNTKVYPILILGLLLLISTPFVNFGGSIDDFRMDFITLCLYGIFVNAVIFSDFFLKTRWSFLTALLATYLILFRMLTCVYFAGVVGLFGIYLFSKKSQVNYSQRLRNLLYFSLVTGGVTLACLAVNKNELYNYYVIGHMVGAEKYIRLSEAGVTGPFSNLLFYPVKFFYKHLPYMAPVGLFLITLNVLYYLRIRKAKKGEVDSLPHSYMQFIQENNSWSLGFVFLLITIIVPLVVLTLDSNKSPVVGGVMVTSVIWLICWYLLSMDDYVAKTYGYVRSLLGVSTVVLVLGLGNQVHEYLHHHSKRLLRDLPVITQMYLDIGDYARLKKWSTINISFDRVCDYLTSGGLASLYFEMRNTLLQVDVEKLGGTIFSLNKEEVLFSLRHSNVLIVNTGSYQDRSVYPFNEAAENLKPFIFSYAKSHFLELGNYQFKGSTYRVYVNDKY